VDPRRTLPALLASGVLLATACGGAGHEQSAPDTTLFGSSVWQEPGESWGEALARIDSAYGPLEVARVFSPGAPPSWEQLDQDVGDRPLVVSFRFLPAFVLSGAADELLAAWFREAPLDRDTYWVYFHEPEDEVERGEFTASDFVEAWRRVASLADAAGNPRLHATVVLMCWTVNPRSDRDWRHFVAGADEVDVLAWDCYAHGSRGDTYVDPDTLLHPARRAADQLGVDWAVAELGALVADADAAQDRASWLEDVGAYATQHGARFVTYFDAPVGGEFRLTDPPSMQAWSQLITGGTS
jgi:hypothetical protein